MTPDIFCVNRNEGRWWRLGFITHLRLTGEQDSNDETKQSNGRAEDFHNQNLQQKMTGLGFLLQKKILLMTNLDEKCGVGSIC